MRLLIHYPDDHQIVGILLGIMSVFLGLGAFLAGYYYLDTQVGGGVHPGDVKVWGFLCSLLTLGLLALAASVYTEK